MRDVPACQWHRFDVGSDDISVCYRYDVGHPIPYVQHQPCQALLSLQLQNHSLCKNTHVANEAITCLLPAQLLAWYSVICSSMHREPLPGDPSRLRLRQPYHVQSQTAIYV